MRKPRHFSQLRGATSLNPLLVEKGRTLNGLNKSMTVSSFAFSRRDSAGRNMPITATVPVWAFQWGTFTTYPPSTGVPQPFASPRPTDNLHPLLPLQFLSFLSFSPSFYKHAQVFDHFLFFLSLLPHPWVTTVCWSGRAKLCCKNNKTILWFITTSVTSCSC